MKRWTKESIVKAIINRHEKGYALNPGTVSVEDNRLYQAVLRHFGNWQKVMSVAHIPGAVYKKNHATPLIHWSKELIAEKIQIRHESENSLQPKSVNDDDSKLYLAAMSYFGSWKTAVEETIGVDYASIRGNVGKWPSNRQPTRKNKNKWSHSKVVTEIQRKVAHGESVRYSDVKTDLRKAGQRLFGSWELAIKSAGYDYDDIRFGRLSANEVIKKIKEFLEQGIPHRDIDQQLHSEACRHYGCWRNAVIASGLEDLACGEWTEELILRAVKARYESGLPCFNTAFKRDDAGLYRAMQRRGSWSEFMQKAGVVLTENDKSPAWKKRVIWLVMQSQGELDKHLVRLAKCVFGSLENAIKQFDRQKSNQKASLS